MVKEHIAEPGGEEQETLVTVGLVLREWGVAGEVLAHPLTFDPARFRDLREVVIERKGRRESGTIETASLRKGRVLLRFEGCRTPEDARRYRGATIRIPRAESPPLPEGVYYHYQIVGLEVFTAGGDCLGRVSEIMETGGNDVYVVRGGSREHLLPAIRNVIVSIDLGAGRMVVRPPETDE